MNTRLKKETGELLPLFIGTLLLIAVPCLVWHRGAAEIASVLLAGSCAVLAGCSFGNEFQHRTLPLLLSQPIARSVLWRDKMLVLGTGIVACLAVAMICLRACAHGFGLAAAITLALIALCAFCGAPYYTLVLRSGVHGTLCAAAAPAGLLAVYALATYWFLTDENLKGGIAALIILIYCAVVYWRGYALFQRLEDVEMPVRDLHLPASLEAVLARPMAGISSRFRGPFASLLKKEFRLQQVSFLLAGMFVLIAVIGFCVIPLYADLGLAIVGADYGIFVVILPLIAGAMAVAEEKGWELAEWHLTLPPSALQQWSAKMLATFATSLTLGLLLPAVIFLVGEPLLFARDSRVAAPPMYHLAAWILSQLLVTSIAVYAASFCKSTMRAILVAVGILIANFGALLLTGWWLSGMLAPALSIHPDQFDRVPAALRVVPLLMLLLMLCLTQRFAWTNFRHLGTSMRRLVIQLLALLILVEGASVPLVAAIYPVWHALHSTP